MNVRRVNRFNVLWRASHSVGVDHSETVRRVTKMRKEPGYVGAVGWTSGMSQSKRY